MVERLSPLKSAAGEHGNLAAGAGVRIAEVTPPSIVQVAAWPGLEGRAIGAIRSVTGMDLPDGPGAGVAGETASCFGFAPGRFTVAGDDPELMQSLASAVDLETGTVTDLSHGRTVLRIAGRKAEWVLAKFFALDFSPAAFPVGAARSTSHHDIFAQIQRTAAEQFDIYVFRSFARSFWKSLRHASEEVGYEIE